MAEQTQTQENFGAGIFRGRKAPANSVYNAVNALVSDEGEMFRRGGSTYLTTSDFGATVIGTWNGQLAGGERTLGWSASELKAVSGTGWQALITTITGVDVAPPAPTGRISVLAGIALWTDGARAFAYGGSLKGATYSTGTASTTADSRTVTGAGTAWSANVDAGMIVLIGDIIGVVKSVESDTSLTLVDPAALTAAGSAYQLTPVLAEAVSAENEATVDCIGVAGQRILLGAKDRVYMSDPLSSSTWLVRTAIGVPTRVLADYHQLDSGSQLLAIAGRADSATVFTTAGIFGIGQLNFDTFDAAGNIQHTVTRGDVTMVAWGDGGLAWFSGGLIVAAVDDVWVLGDAALSEPIRPLYRAYVEAGYRPGWASVYRGHYFLPILNGSTVIDVLVCRVDRGGAWTRWDDHAAGGGYTVDVGTTTDLEPKFYAATGQRIADVTGCFDPDAARDDDADGTDHQMTVETRDFDLVGPGRRPGTAGKAAVVYELSGTGCTAELSWASGEEGSAYTALTPIRGGGTSDGSTYSVWAINKTRRSVRLKIVQSGAAAKMILRSISLTVRRNGQ